MQTLLKRIIGKAKREIRYKYEWMIENVFTASPLVSGTLDQDDVDLARNQLKNKRRWIGASIEKQYGVDFAQWNGSKYAFAFMGGRVALSACIYALGLKRGDEVILPGYTCVVVPNAFDFEGIQVVYSDIELDTYGLDISSLEKRITPKTKAILIQHLYGLVCRDYEKILALAKQHQLYIIEDCSHSTGAMFKNAKIGNLGDVAFYSTEQSKILNTIQGGIVITNSEQIAGRLAEFYEKAPYPADERIEKQLYNLIIHYYTYKHPQRWWRGRLQHFLYKDKIYESTTSEEVKGIKPKDYGCKMPAAIAAIGINQLNKVDSYNQIRRKNSERWATWCDAHGYKKPFIVCGSTPVYLRYPVLVEPEKKCDTLWAYRELGITLGVWFVSHIHPSNRVVEGCPNADKAVKQCINFPTLIYGGIKC